jgi:hypothetical protein
LLEELLDDEDLHENVAVAAQRVIAAIDAEAQA